MLNQPREIEEQDKPTKQAQEKKNPTIGDFEEDVPPPNVIACQPSQYALKRIAVYEYIMLWYFMKDGCFKAMKQVHSQADITFGLLSTNEVLTLCPVVLSKALKNAKADHKLSLTKILQVQTLYLEHIKKAGWPEKHILVLFKFSCNSTTFSPHMQLKLDATGTTSSSWVLPSTSPSSTMQYYARLVPHFPTLCKPTHRNSPSSPNPLHTCYVLSIPMMFLQAALIMLEP